MMVPYTQRCLFYVRVSKCKFKRSDFKKRREWARLHQISYRESTTFVKISHDTLRFLKLLRLKRCYRNNCATFAYNNHNNYDNHHFICGGVRPSFSISWIDAGFYSLMLFPPYSIKKKSNQISVSLSHNVAQMSSFIVIKELFFASFAPNNSKKFSSEQ